MTVREEVPAIWASATASMVIRALTAAKAFARFYVRRMDNMVVASVTVRTVGRVPSATYPLGIAKFPIATNMASAYEVHAFAILVGKDHFALKLTVRIPAAVDMAPALQANAIARLVGKAKGVTRWTKESTNVCQAAPNMVLTI